MTEQSPLASPAAWDAVSEAYTTEFLPLFALYAKDAIALAELSRDARVLDVAAGPGTLSLLVAEQVHHVSAVDFADSMVHILKRRAAEAGVGNIDAQIADGQALPFDDHCFDAAFSMFGLMFFPDRDAGFRQLLRVLKPGGRAVVSSWAPINEAPLLAELFDCLRALLPDLSFGGDAPPPLSDPEQFRDEMTEAGFRDVSIHTVKHRVEVPSVEHFWASQEKASAPIVLLRSRLSEGEWRETSARVIAGVEKKFGAGPLSLAWPARLGAGIRGHS